MIGGFVNNIVDNLIEENDMKKLSELYEVLEKVNEESALEKRGAAEDAYYENLKRYLFMFVHCRCVTTVGPEQWLNLLI